MNINKTELQVQIDGDSAHVSDFAPALSVAETYKLKSGVIDRTQVSTLPVGCI